MMALMMGVTDTRTSSIITDTMVNPAVKSDPTIDIIDNALTALYQLGTVTPGTAIEIIK